MKKIIIGDINESYKGTPIQMFKQAIELSKQEEFIVYTNDPQFVEALEVLCGANNVKIYIRLEEKCIEVGFLSAYNYLGDMYNTIDAIRLEKAFKYSNDDNIAFSDYKFLDNEIKRYEENILEKLI